MKITKILLSTLSAATLAFIFSACPTTVSNNAANKANTAVVTSNKAMVNNAAPVSNTVKTPTVNNTPTDKSDAEKIDGQLQTGKTESLILYVGKESGDYAAYCFPNDSDAGRKIFAECKDGDQCEVTGEVAEGKCTVPGLEANLSASARFVNVLSVKKLAAAKK
ncbi:MAG: hypothetical protein WA584_06985 [Pyrinomonadaceae bacterium]